MKSSGKNFSDKAINFFTKLGLPENLPDDIDILNPYQDKEVKRITAEFFTRFFNDNNKRIFILGINPGRFGGGVTGIPFTDPIALEENCGIKNDFIKRAELSSRFVYSFIKEFGGTKKFYSKFFISAAFPLALTKSGKNYNYYDDPKLYNNLKPYLISSLKKQLMFGAKKETAICLGKKNSAYLNELNRELNYFVDIIALDHPRFIMQYRLKKKEQYIQKYIQTFKSLIK